MDNNEHKDGWVIPLLTVTYLGFMGFLALINLLPGISIAPMYFWILAGIGVAVIVIELILYAFVTLFFKRYADVEWDEMSPFIRKVDEAAVLFTYVIMFGHPLLYGKSA